jgi:hypothetical protein
MTMNEKYIKLNIPKEVLDEIPVMLGRCRWKLYEDGIPAEMIEPLLWAAYEHAISNLELEGEDDAN